MRGAAFCLGRGTGDTLGAAASAKVALLEGSASADGVGFDCGAGRGAGDTLGAVASAKVALSEGVAAADGARFDCDAKRAVLSVNGPWSRE